MCTNAGICTKAAITEFKRNKNFWIPDDSRTQQLQMLVSYTYTAQLTALLVSKFTLSLALKAEHSAVGALCSSTDSAHSPPLKKALGEGTS